jgi:hypothetical protein
MSPVVIVGEEFSALSFSHLFSSPLDLQLSPKSSAASFAPALTGGVLVWMVVQHQPVVVWPAHGCLEANACDIDGFGLCGHSMVKDSSRGLRRSSRVVMVSDTLVIS